MLQSPAKCQNCGTVLGEHKFCPECGQSATVGRLSTKGLLTDVITSMTRINRGFAYTCAMLLLRPWRVIADFIHGRRVSYTGPAQMLLLLCFFLYVIFPAVGLWNNDDLTKAITLFDESSTTGVIINHVLMFIISTPSLAYLLMFIPALPALRLVYRSNGSWRFNTAEYLLAAIYMSDAVLVVECITTILDPITAGHADSVGNVYILMLGVISVTKAFPIPGWVKPTLKIVTLGAIVALTYVALLLSISLIIGGVIYACH